MAPARLTIDLDKIEHNARAVVSFCREHGIDVTGVTKGVCGHPEIAKAMLRGGVSSLGESRLENIHRLRRAGIDAPCTLLRVPPLSEAANVVASADVSLNSELSVLTALSDVAGRLGVVHDVIVMVELGDLREGVMPENLMAFCAAAHRLSAIRLAGLGANLACFAGVVPSEANMNQLIALAHEVESTCGLSLDLISGINSSALDLIAAGRMPREVNHARIGEAILLGRETVHRNPWPGTLQDAFILDAEVLERKTKPSTPIGERGEDAFGGLPVWEDRGDRVRALLNVGREDVRIQGLTPVETGVTILGGSSGYLVVDVTDARRDIEVGAELAFSPNYGALLSAMSSAYLRKLVLRQGEPVEDTAE
ncbi:MAG: alanine/ornithine racemase family PLP-dependent enzyme [Alphaproteobacteria bacterium]|nr:alanine/ornithine racemase family PLP-dependent enzyme [Alphaproteobacteria bacterium]